MLLRCVMIVHVLQTSAHTTVIWVFLRQPACVPDPGVCTTGRAVQRTTETEPLQRCTDFKGKTKSGSDWMNSYNKVVVNK